MSCYQCKKGSNCKDVDMYYGGKIYFHDRCIPYFKAINFTETLKEYLKGKKVNIENYEREIREYIEEMPVMPFFKDDIIKVKHGYLIHLSIVIMLHFLEPEMIKADDYNPNLKYRIKIKYCNKDSVISLRNLQQEIINILEMKWSNF